MKDPISSVPQEGFKEKWDPISNHDSTITINRFQTSQAILEALKNKRKTETIEWLNGLEKEISVSNNVNPRNSGNSLPSLSAYPTTVNAAQPNTEYTMMGQAIQWLDRIFVQFELFAANFNMNVQGTNLVVSCTRPIKRTNNTSRLYSEASDDCLSYAGHIATQLWALVVRGCAAKVEIFIIPTELLIAFSVSSTDGSGYEPLLVIESAWHGKEIIWHVQNKLISADQIPDLAKELFGDLIKVASGQMTETEVIASPIQTISSHDNPVIPLPHPSAPKTNPAPLIAQLVNPNSSTALSNPNPNSLPTQPVNLLNAASTVSSQSFASLKAADQLLILLNTDIKHLMESGKQALELDDNATFERVKELTGQLEALKKSISVALSNIHQSQ